MKILVIIPAYNEEKFLPGLLGSLLSQERVPDQMLVVDDGSTDGTAGIVKAFEQKDSRVQLIQNLDKKPREVGAKVVQAFLLGYNSVKAADFDVVCKIDADLIFPVDYFERLEEMFIENPNVGLAGGTCAIEVGGEWIREPVSNKSFLRGPIKAYRMECYQQLGGLTPVMGWDTIDQIKAKLHGWTVKVDNSLLVKHLRPTNTETGWVKINIKNGKAIYQYRYGLVISLYSCLKRGWKHTPYFFSGLVTLYGFILGWTKRLPFHFTKEEAQLVRKQIWGQRVKKYNNVNKK